MCKTKKMLSMVLAFGMVASMSATAFAAAQTMGQTSSKIEVVRLSDNISEQVITEITDGVECSLMYDDGTIVPIHSVVTIEEINTGSKSLADTYAVTLSSKIDSDSADKNSSNTTASATLKLVWTDGKGINNTIDEVSGTLDVVKGKVHSGTVRYGDGWASAISWDKKDVGNKSSFSYSPNYGVPDPTADYSIAFKDELFSMSMSVSANVFQ